MKASGKCACMAKASAEPGASCTWRKLHLGVDESSGEIVAAVLSSNNLSDGEVLPMLLEQVEDPLAQVSGDGAYDKRSCYEALHQRELHQQRKEAEPALKVAIPPRRGDPAATRRAHLAARQSKAGAPAKAGAPGAR